jgi:hypothetical protein
MTACVGSVPRRALAGGQPQRTGTFAASEGGAGALSWHEGACLASVGQEQWVRHGCGMVKSKAASDDEAVFVDRNSAYTLCRVRVCLVRGGLVLRRPLRSASLSAGL